MKIMNGKVSVLNCISDTDLIGKVSLNTYWMLFDLENCCWNYYIGYYRIPILTWTGLWVVKTAHGLGQWPPLHFGGVLP
jgi:hypothetical protein